MTPTPLGWAVVAAVTWMLVLACLAHAAPRPTDRSLSRCFVYLPAVHDAKLRRWCLAQSRRLP